LLRSVHETIFNFNVQRPLNGGDRVEIYGVLTRSTGSGSENETEQLILAIARRLSCAKRTGDIFAREKPGVEEGRRGAALSQRIDASLTSLVQSN